MHTVIDKTHFRRKDTDKEGFKPRGSGSRSKMRCLLNVTLFPSSVTMQVVLSNLLARLSVKIWRLARHNGLRMMV